MIAPPAYLPATIRRRLAGKRFALGRVPEVVRRRLRSPEKIGVAEFAAQYRVVTDGAHQGPWRHHHAPHTVQIMEAFGRPWVREIWFCGVEQSGKTNTMLNCLAWAIDCDPGDAFYLMPTEATSDKVVGGKIRPMLQQSPRLARYLTGRADDLTLSRIRLGHGMTIHPAHANSPASMATWSAKHCFGDEIDKNPPMAGKETDSITLIRKRTRTYRGRYKRFFASTPAGVHIYRGTMACPQVWQYRVRCPHCDELVKMDADHLVLPEGATVESLEAVGLVGYACNSCGVIWDEEERRQAIRRGRWLAIKGSELLRPTRIGFHHRSWECLDVTLLEIGVAWLKEQLGDLADKISWANGYLAEDYQHVVQQRDEEHILRLVDPAMPRLVVPRGAACLVMLADTQRTGFYYEIWAYSGGRDLTTHRIDHGFLLEFQHLVAAAGQSYLDPDGKEYRVQAALIDSGGGTNPNRPKHSRTAEVYEFCKLNPLFKPLKGRQKMDTPWNVSRLDYYPGAKGQKVPIPGGILLYKINTTLYKDELARRLQIEPDGPGAYHLHAEMGIEYARQMCAEYQDDRGFWVCPNGKANHHWDLGVYGLAAADIFRIKDYNTEARPGRRVYSKGVQL